MESKLRGAMKEKCLGLQIRLITWMSKRIQNLVNLSMSEMFCAILFAGVLFKEVDGRPSQFSHTCVTSEVNHAALLLSVIRLDRRKELLRTK